MQSPRRTAGLSGSELAEGLGAQRAVELQILLFCLALEALALLKGLPAGAALVAAVWWPPSSYACATRRRVS